MAILERSKAEGSEEKQSINYPVLTGQGVIYWQCWPVYRIRRIVNINQHFA